MESLLLPKSLQYIVKTTNYNYYTFKRICIGISWDWIFSIVEIKSIYDNSREIFNLIFSLFLL